MIEDFYNSTALVEKQIPAQTSMGGVKKNWATRIASVAGRFDIKSAIGTAVNEAEEFAKMTTRQIETFFCEASTVNKAIIESDRMTIDGRIYLVTGVRNPGLLDRHLEIGLEQIR